MIIYVMAKSCLFELLAISFFFFFSKPSFPVKWFMDIGIESLCVLILVEVIWDSQKRPRLAFQKPLEELIGAISNELYVLEKSRDENITTSGI